MLNPEVWNLFFCKGFGNRVDPECHPVDSSQSSEMGQIVTELEGATVKQEMVAIWRFRAQVFVFTGPCWVKINK